jgi:hypothetical protein
VLNNLKAYFAILFVNVILQKDSNSSDNKGGERFNILNSDKWCAGIVWIVCLWVKVRCHLSFNVVEETMHHKSCAHFGLQWWVL